MFNHENFEAYQISYRYLTIAFQLADQIPRGYSAIKDQLIRASMSICLNIAEGSGKNSFADRSKFYVIARGSAMECAAICDILTITSGVDSQKIIEARKMLNPVASILTVVILGKKKVGRDWEDD